MTILTPKGYSSARRPSSERPEPPAPAPQPASAPPPSPQPAEPQAAQPTADLGRRAVRLKFPPQVMGVNCPNCGATYPIQVFNVIDVGQDPVLKPLLLSGQLNVAVCPRCGVGGAIATPLLYHDPEHNFLGVYVPEQAGANKQQEVIGQLSRRLMDNLPPEARRGYMLTPKQFLTYQSLLEKILEFEGITREMLDKQRRQLQLLDQALTALQDPEGLRQLVKDRNAEMDDEFFALLQSLINSSVAAGDESGAHLLVDLRERLIELTSWGESVQRQRAALAQLKPDTSPEELLEMVVSAQDERVVEALVTAARPLVGYTFFQALTERSEAAQARGDVAEAKRLASLRDHILEYTRRLDQLQRAVVQQAVAVLNEILAADDVRQAVAERADLIDETFLSVLAANLQEAERRRADQALEKLQAVWDAVMEIVEQSAPPEVALINRLLAADYPRQTRQILAENKAMLTDQFMEALDALASQMEANGDAQVARRLRQIRSQAQLMR
ncbi:MAG: CpXC domain-containing protein [Caldilineales bacterium]|nr:CpXC domain-containing protein [Caldilineales bacterium]